MTSSIFSFCHFYRLPLLSGILIGTSYIPSYPIAVFWSFVPLWAFFLKNLQTKNILIGGWITQFVLTLIGFHWVAHTAHEFGHLPWAVSILVLIGFASFSSLHVMIAGFLWFRVQRWLQPSTMSSLFLLAGFTVLGEIYFPMIFPWHHGYVWLWADWQGFQFADIIGTQGLSAICIFSNIYFYSIWKKHQNNSWPKTIAKVVAFVCVFFAFNFAGKKYAEPWHKTNAEKSILVVQANIGNLAKYFSEQGNFQAMKSIAEKYFRLTEEALNAGEKPDFILWPETAYPEYLNPPFLRHRYNVLLRQKVQKWQVPLMTGGYKYKLKEKQTYNGVFFIDLAGKIQDPPYTKSILLAFGEYFPGAEYFPFLKKLVPAISNFSRGPGPTVVDFYGVRFAPQICYEGLYPDFSRELAQLGTEIIFNVTNDSWFGASFEPYQHLYMTLGRAIEVRRPLVRSTNTGITTAILANGEILKKSPLFTEWSHTFPIKYQKNSKQTIYTRFGHLLPYFFIVLISLHLIWMWNARRKDRK